MSSTKIFKFRLARLSLTAPTTWQSPPLIRRLLHPSQPELYGTGGPGYEYLWFDKPIEVEGDIKFEDLANHLIGTVQSRANQLIAKGKIVVNGQVYPTVTFEKNRAEYAPTTMKRYAIVLRNRLCTIGARLSHNHEPCYTEHGYDQIVQSIKKI